jgi:DeoR/GlpR family transcriptional regulator of sugar metabolism
MKQPFQVDLARLAGILTRVNGGAVLNQQEHFQNNSFIERHPQIAASKLAIARQAAVFC